jgi:hypothetical protein
MTWWTLGGWVIYIVGWRITLRQGKRWGREMAENAVGDMVPGGAPMAAFIIAMRKVGEQPHSLNGTFQMGDDGTSYRAFTIAHPPGCKTKRCPTTKAIKRFGPVAHVHEELA